MASKKTTIHEFDPCIYPRLLWVVKGGELEEIKKTLDLGDFEPDGSEGALTITTRRISDKQVGVLVWFPKVSDMKNLDWIAHESAHVSLYIYHEVGAVAEFENQEPFAYLVGWVFKCVDEVRKFKEVKYGSEDSQSANAEKSQLETPCEETQENR